MSVRPSTINLDTEFAESAILEKVESQLAPGELTPVHNDNPAVGTGEWIDSKLEEGSLSASAEAGGTQPITHRPTGLRVFHFLISSEFVVGIINDLFLDRTFLVCIG